MTSIETIVTRRLEKYGAMPVGVLYKKVNAFRWNQKGTKVSDVIRQMVVAGILTLTIVKSGQRGRPQQVVALGPNHINNQPATQAVESEDKSRGEIGRASCRER